jgi:hypothetical protein
MQEAYHLGNLPQGLKALAYRLLGVRMQSWEDLVLPPSREKAVEWLRAEWDDESEHRVRVEKQLKTKVKVEFKPTQRERDIRRILSHSWKEKYDIWEKAEECGLGGIPRPSIRYARMADSVSYACRDSDITLQVAGKLVDLRDSTMTQWQVVEEDWDQ